MPEIYQDVWQLGKVVQRGVRECGSRWALIAPTLKKYKRPFTLLDIGANLGYFGIRAAHEHGAVAVMVDYDSRLIDQCKANFLVPTLIALHHELTIESLTELAECECFDVVLALSVLHHFGKEAKRAAEVVIGMGDHVFIETPNQYDVGACGREALEPLYFRMLGEFRAEFIGDSPSHTDPDRPRLMFHVKQNTNTQVRHRVAIGVEAESKWAVTSDNQTRTVSFERKQELRPWIHGINLQTWIRMGGKWPPKSEVLRMLKEFKLPEEHHGDIRPWNFILDGDYLYLIDGYDERANFDDEEGLALTIAEVEAC